MTDYNYTPGVCDLSGVIGDDWACTLDFDIDITGFTWEAKLVDKNGTEVCNIAVFADSQSEGVLTLTIPDASTDLLSEKSYRWYLKQTNAELERTWLAGYFRFYKRQSARFGGSAT